MIRHVFKVAKVELENPSVSYSSEIVTLVPDHLYNRNEPGHNGNVKSEITLSCKAGTYPIGTMLLVSVFTEEELMERDTENAKSSLRGIIEGNITS